MKLFSDEMLLYIGLIVASASILSAIAFSVIYKLRKKKLNSSFDIEYGQVQKSK